MVVSLSLLSVLGNRTENFGEMGKGNASMRTFFPHAQLTTVKVYIGKFLHVVLIIRVSSSVVFGGRDGELGGGWRGVHVIKYTVGNVLYLL